MNRERTFETPLGTGTVAPHRDRELELLLAGTKPAALLDRKEARQAAAAGMVTKRGPMGWMAARDQASLERLERATAGAPMQITQYVQMGLALGYTPADILAFVIRGTLNEIEIEERCL